MGIELVLLRHGESEWNRANRFTGWTDVPLSKQGIQEAHRAGHLLRAAGYLFDEAHTSLLARAIQTLWIVMEEMDMMWLPVHRSWRLNERHYGALQGLDKEETAREFGEAQVLRWRRSYDVRPPALAPGDPRHPGCDRRYAHLPRKDLPTTESLKDTLERVQPYWHEAIAPALKRQRRILIVAHGNSLRALVKVLDNVSDEQIATLNIPTGFPLVYELDDELSTLGHHYLGDTQEIVAATAAVVAQGTLGRAG